MNGKNLKWARFASSGRVSDYLEYRASLRMEAAREDMDFDALEDNDAFEYRRSCDKGESDGRK